MDPVGLAQTEFLLAKALFVSRPRAPQKTEALALARSAEQRFQAIGETAVEDLEAVTAWLEQRSKP